MALPRWIFLCVAAVAGSIMAGASGAATPPNGLVVLFTDYGADSIYVGVLKGTIYSKFPAARIDAITNSVPAFDVVTGAHMLAEACPEFPEGTTFCCVVDPGVGTPRKRIVLETKAGQFFVGPDNGLLSVVASRFGVAALREATNQAWWRHGAVSQTFQGRDIFGPVAATVARGTPLTETGPELGDLVRLPIEGCQLEGNAITGTVIRADWYGNLVTNITGETLAKAGITTNEMVEVRVGSEGFTAPVKSTYADVPEGQRLLLIQSTGYVEFAINKGNLAETVKAGAHAPIVIKKTK